MTTIGLAGAGTIGSGLIRPRSLRLKAVLVRDAGKRRPGLPAGTAVTTRSEDLTDGPGIDVVVELLGGVDEALRVVSRALAQGKAVVTANKNLLAEGGPERKIPTSGIDILELEDVRQAETMGYRIKLLAAARRSADGQLEAEVAVLLLPREHPLASVRMEYNAVLVDSEGLVRTLLSGKGAGPAPTAVTVLADLLDIADGRA